MERFMKHLSRTLALSVAALGLMAAPAFAQTTDAVKDQAVDMAKDTVKDKATDMAKDKAKDMAADAIKSETAGDVMVKGAEGVMKDKVNETAMDMAEDHAKDKAKDMAKKEMMGEPTMETGDVMEAPAVIQSPVEAPLPTIATDTPVQTINIACPSGTTAQPDGTCMITGDYQGDE